MTDRVQKWDRRFINLARVISTWSHDPSTKCGAVIVDDKRRIVSTGYNGFAQGMIDTQGNYDDRDEKYSRIIHCEMNALLFAPRSLAGCTLYTWPFLSCDRCFVHMAQAGIWRYVAPKPVLPSHIERWGPIIAKTKQYAAEMDLVTVEYDDEPIATMTVYVEHDIHCSACGTSLVRATEQGATFCISGSCSERLRAQEGVTQ